MTRQSWIEHVLSVREPGVLDFRARRNVCETATHVVETEKTVSAR